MFDSIKKMLAGKPSPAPAPAAPATAISSVTAQTNKDVVNDPRFEVLLDRSRLMYRCFTLAGGTDPFLPPLIRFSPDGKTIILEKCGYEAWIGDLKGYYNGTVWAEREACLHRFFNKFFGEYAQTIRVDPEYIADYLISFESLEGCESDFVLKWDFPCCAETAQERNLLRSEIQKTPIFETYGQN